MLGEATFLTVHPPPAALNVSHSWESPRVPLLAHVAFPLHLAA